MRQRDLIPFFTMTFLIAWGILGLYIFASETMVRLFGNLTGQHPLFYMAVYAPAIWAALLLGVVWAVWHLPAFMLSSTPQSAWALTPFLVGTLALSIIVTPLFNHSRGSLLLPAFFHLQLITLRHLLTHSAGIPDHVHMDTFKDP